jgi:predicted dehydrogenase
MKIAFIGAGGIAGNYRGSLKRLNQPISVICDVNMARAEAVAKEENAKPYADHKEMLLKEKPDVVFVCIPPGAHTTQVADSANSGAALFVAKPIAFDMETALRTRDAIEKVGVINQVGYMARYNDISAKAKELIGGRKLAMGVGRFLCRMGASHPWWGKFKISGGQMLEQTTHVFDLLRYFMGDVEKVQAFGIKGVSSSGIADFEECTVCNLYFANGAVGNVTSTCVSGAPEGFAAEVVGDDLYLKFVLDTRLYGNISGQRIDYTGEETGYYRQVEKFIQAVKTNSQESILSNYADAAKTLAITISANRSMATSNVEKVDAV